MIFDIPLDLDKQSSADKKGFGRMTIEIFDGNLLVPTTLHDTRYAGSVISVALVDLHLQNRLRMPGVNADDGQPHLIQLGPQPCRRCSGLQPNPNDVWRVQFDECRDRLRARMNHSLTLNLSSSIDNADCC